MRITLELSDSVLEQCRSRRFGAGTAIELLDQIADIVAATDAENAKGGVVIYSYDGDRRRWNLPDDLRSARSVYHADGASYCLGKCSVPGRHQIIFEAPLDYAGERTEAVHLLSIGGDGQVRWTVSRDTLPGSPDDREAVRVFRLH